MFGNFALSLQKRIKCKVFEIMKKYIGNVIVSSPNYKVDECFNKCLNIENIDETLPTLIIGLEKAKKNIEKFNILIKNYNNGMLWWTFSKTERRIDYEKDIIDFHNHCIANIVGKIDYHFINYVDLTYNKAKKCLRYIRNNHKKRYYVDNGKFIFVYDTENGDKSKNIYGFSLTTSAFFGLERKKILSVIENNPNNKQIKNFYSVPNKIRTLVKDDIPSEMVLLEYF